MSDYKELIVWRRAFALVKDVYLITAKFPADERFGLVSQMRRAAISIPSNVAEGCSRRSVREFAQFISHAEGSAAELETQFLLSGDLGYVRGECLEKVLAGLTEIRKMLGSLRRRLSTKS